MNWGNWQANIEQIYTCFIAIANPLSVYGPMTKANLITYCENNYGKVPPDINMEKIENILSWNYATTWNNTNIPAMYKLGLLYERNDNTIDLTPAGKQLFRSEITPITFFRRQLLEYQYKNPYQQGDLKSNSDFKCNLFPYWIILKILSIVNTISYEEAIYIVLKLDNYDDNILSDTINKINLLRKLKSETNPADLNDILVENFGEPNSRSKAWQYERNFLKWIGFCEENKSGLTLKLSCDDSDLSILNGILSKYPSYKDFKSEEDYSSFVGREFSSSSKCFLIVEGDNIYISSTRENNKLILEVSNLLSINKDDCFFYSNSSEEFMINSLWKVHNISFIEDKKIIEAFCINELKNPLSINSISKIINNYNIVGGENGN